MEAQRLMELIEVAGYDHYSYSGRGMFGATCVAMDCENIVAAIADLCSMSLDYTECDFIGKAKQDNMGMEYIIYWPDVAYPTSSQEAS